MALDFQEGVENAMLAKAFADQVIAFAKSIKREEGDGKPPVRISEITDGIAALVKDAGKLAEKIQVDVKD